MSLQVGFLVLTAWPSVTKYLERGVMVEISKIPEAQNGYQIVEPVITPAITFCPYRDLKSVFLIYSTVLYFTLLYCFSAGWATPPLQGPAFSDFVMTFCNRSNMQGESLIEVSHLKSLSRGARLCEEQHLQPQPESEGCQVQHG